MNRNLNRGFLSTPTAFIRQIRTNLVEGRYERDPSGFTIFKELLQNADDAGQDGSSFVSFGLSTGIPKASHPLLRGPALYVINDGAFDSQDEKNICRFGENSKSLDSTKIGKFGLGLKSLFHLCEAFFYFYVVHQDDKAKLRPIFFNPWYSGGEDDLHPEWDNPDRSDLTLVLKELQPLFNQKPCFSLWVPLRQESHLAGKHPITQYFPGDHVPSWLTDTTLPNSIQTVLPLLKHVGTVRGFDGSGNSAVQTFCLNFDESSTRRAAFSELSSRGVHAFSGTVVANDNHQLNYVAYETLQDDSQLVGLHESEFWPDDVGFDPQTGKPLQVKEKAEQHGSCCVTIARLAKGTQGELTMGWSVFLPLGTPKRFSLELPFRVSISLHGYFFTDAGRNGPVGLTTGFCRPTREPNAQSVKAHWNFRLAESAVLPLLPQSLATALNHSAIEIPDELRESLTRAIRGSEIFSQAQNAICRDHCWVFAADAKGESQWSLRASGERMLVLPGNSSSANVAWKVFPKLADLAREHVLSFEQTPKLCHSSFSTDWTPRTISNLFQSLDHHAAADSSEHLRYFADFLGFVEKQHRCCVEPSVVVQHVRRLFQAAGMARLVDAKDDYRELVRSIPACHRVAIELAAEQSDLLQAILADESSVLFVPKLLEPPESQCAGRIETEICVCVLQRLAKAQAIADADTSREIISRLAATILSLANSKVEVIERCGNLPLFVASDCRKRKDAETLVSWNQLNRRRESQTLFVQPPSRAYQLQNALQNESLLLVNSEVFGILFPGVANRPTCSPTQILSTLSRDEPPRLASAVQRKPLLEVLLDFQGGRQIEGFRESVRYLLHGNSDAFASTCNLLVSSAGQSDVWRRIAMRKLRADDAEWQLIDNVLADLLSPALRNEFMVRELDAQVAIHALSNCDPTIFSDLRPSETEYNDLLAALIEPTICKRLPIHETIDGRFVPIDDHCFWYSEKEIPSELVGSFTLLKPSNNPETKHRQKKLARCLDDLAVMKIALDSAEPQRHWQLILDTVSATEDIPNDIASKLRTCRWLVLSDNSVVSPGDVIQLPKLHDEVKKIVATYPKTFFEPLQISQKFVKHEAYDYLEEHCFADIETSLAMVGELLKTQSTNAIGPVSEAQIDEWIEAAAELPEAVFPASRLIGLARKHYPTETCSLVQELKQTPIGIQRIVDLMDAFRNLQEQARAANQKNRLLNIFNLYLAMLLDQDNFASCLKEQRLLNRKGVWASSINLTFANDGIADSGVVHSSIEAVLAHSLDEIQVGAITQDEADNSIAIDWDSIDSHLSKTGGKLQGYFRPWENAVPTEQVGGFLALLGDDGEVCELAQQFLGGNRTLEQTRRKFGLQDLRDKHDEVREDGLTMISKQRVVVEIVSTPIVAVANLFGETIELERNLSPSSIFVGYGQRNIPFPHRVIDGKRILCFRLSAIDTRKIGPAELSDLLRDSCVKLIEQAYNQYENQTRFSSAWEELSQSDQLDIGIAQALIIDNAFLILAQYGLKSDPKLGPVIRAWDAAQKLIAEQSSGVATARFGSRDANVERDKAKAGLRELLENDYETQQRIIAAVRHRIERHCQYTIPSIPFEIFQNADDTCVQLAKHFRDSTRNDEARVFHLFQDDQRIVFAHFGRCINQYPLDDATLRSKFEDDLWSMLVLNLSSKATDDASETAEVTGKYGLGFKSSYLVSDSPRIISGRLGFEVNGAMYPRRLVEGVNGEQSYLSKLRDDRFGTTNRTATLIELPLDHADASDLLWRFKRLCGFQVIFARHISSIVFSDGFEVCWNPTPIGGVAECFVGNVNLGYDQHSQSKTRAIQFKNQFGSLLLNLDADGFACFDDEVPSIWVTAPTEVRLRTGFIVNGSFNIDVGRAQLSRDFAVNEAIATKLGRELGKQFVELFSRTCNVESWKALVAELELSNDSTQYDFFDSLFSIYCNAKSSDEREPGQKLLHDIVWKDDQSAGSVLVSQVAGLPTRLEGEYRTLVAGKSVRYVLTGILESDSDLFSFVCQWELFRSKAPIGSVVSHRTVASPLRRLRPHLLASAEVLRLETVLQWELGEALFCDPELGIRLGQVVTRQLLIESDQADEQRDLESLLRKVKFKGRDGKFHQSVKLLCPHLSNISSDFETQSDEESARGAFAPSSCLLSEEYCDEALVFFDACRGRMEAPSRLMSEWVLKARDVKRQVGALQYLAQGELRQPLIGELKQLGLAGTWLDNLADSEAFGEIEENDRWRLRELLPSDKQPTIQWSQWSFSPPVARRRSATDCLLAVSDWWMSARDQPSKDFGGRSLIGEFEYRTYLHGSPTHLLNDGADQRRDWMTLFLLALFHIQGRAKPGQHRGFLSMCENNGWLSLFSSNDRDPESWMQFVENYLDQQVDDAAYLHWMRQFVGIFQLNRHLDDYIECFLAIDRIEEPFSLTHILNSKSSHLFQGGGFDAPPLSRQLGLGACFVVRELVRLRVLKSQFAHVHSFVPTRRVRNLFSQLGCSDLEQDHHRWEVSSLICQFVGDAIGEDRACFGNDFDIPFQFIAEDSKLQETLLHCPLEIDESDESQDVFDWDIFTP